MGCNSFDNTRRGPQEKALADDKFEVELEAKSRLGNKRKGKAFRDAMIASLLGGPHEAASVAKHKGKTVTAIDIFFEMANGGYQDRIFVNFVTPAVEFRLEDHEADPMP